jgi:hypothetical protein
LKIIFINNFFYQTGESILETTRGIATLEPFLCQCGYCELIYISFPLGKKRIHLYCFHHISLTKLFVDTQRKQMKYTGTELLNEIEVTKK